MTVLPLHQLKTKRFRLQFLGEELDFPVQGTAVIGRSGSCDITLFDPLISRRHAQIVVERDTVTIEDLGSHNGTRVNGVRIRGPRKITSGDRIGLGKNEFVFREVSAVGALENDTASLVYCASCHLVYPKEAGACPHCASQETVTQVTKSGVYDEEAHDGWALQMLVSVLTKAITLGERRRAEQLMQEAMTKVDKAHARGALVDAADMKELMKAAARLSEVTGDERWARWGEQADARIAFRATVKMLQSG